jgi:hypothetical protein
LRHDLTGRHSDPPSKRVQSMIKKLFISAVILTALISAKESRAAGAGGFARMLGTADIVQVQEHRDISGTDL